MRIRSTRHAILRMLGGVVILAPVLLLLLLEVGARAAGVRFPRLPRPGESGDRGLWAHHSSRGWAHSPGATGTAFLGGPDSARVRINTLGLRGREITRFPSPDRRRVLVIGDSFVFGAGVDEDHTFAVQLERELGPGYEVLNLGVSGYSTDQEYLLFEELGSGLGGAVVVLVMCDNDFLGNTEDFAYGAYFKPFYELTPDGLVAHNRPVPTRTRAQDARLWLSQRSNAWNALRSASRRLAGTDALFGVAKTRVSDGDAAELTAALVLALRDAAAATGTPLVVFNTGHRGEETPLFHGLRPTLRENAVPFLGFEETLARAREQDPSGNWDFGHDPHWNVDAHRLCARVAAAFLAESGALSR